MAKRPRSPLHAPLEPADDKAIGNGAGGRLHQLLVIIKRLHGAAFAFEGGPMLDEECGEFGIAEPRAPKGVSHLRSSSAGLMPHRVGGADRSAGVAGSRLQVGFRKAGAVGDLAVGHRIVGAAAGERDRGVAVAPLQRVQQVEKGLLVNCLGGKCQIAVTLLDRRVRLTRRSSESMSACENKAPHTGSPPGHS
jgi:hypothetical protein